MCRETAAMNKAYLMTGLVMAAMALTAPAEAMSADAAI
jgi:hypothetical protein